MEASPTPTEAGQNVVKVKWWELGVQGAALFNRLKFQDGAPVGWHAATTELNFELPAIPPAWRISQWVSASFQQGPLDHGWVFVKTEGIVRSFRWRGS